MVTFTSTPSTILPMNTPVRKVTPVASKSWKENLRRACLTRARNSRIGRTSTSTTSPADMLEPPSSAVTADDGVVEMARNVIEDELRQRSIEILPVSNWSGSPMKVDHDAIVRMETSNADGTTPESNLPRANHYITEEELFELLAEVEMEMEAQERNDEEYLFEMAQQEYDYLQWQVNDYEQWEEHSRMD